VTRTVPPATVRLPVLRRSASTCSDVATVNVPELSARWAAANLPPEVRRPPAPMDSVAALVVIVPGSARSPVPAEYDPPVSVPPDRLVRFDTVNVPVPVTPIVPLLVTGVFTVEDWTPE